MWLYTARPPEIGEEEIGHREQPCNSGGERHKRVHIRRPMAQLLPSIDEKTTAKPEKDNRRQHKGNPIAPGMPHEKHADDHNRKREPDGPPHPPFQILISFCCYLVGVVGFIFRDDQAITGILNRFAERFGRRHGRIPLHRGYPARIVHCRRTYARCIFQRLLNAGGAGRTTHSRDGKISFFHDF